MSKQAIRESIAHWVRMRDMTDFSNPKEEPYANDCPLCKLYLFDSCQDCDIYIKTGRTDCKFSEYANAIRAWGRLFTGTWSRRLEWSYRSQLMINFLESLLPEDDIYFKPIKVAA